MRKRTGGQVLIDHLISYGSEMAFCVPGESFLGALDAFYDRGDSIKLITCRHEAGAANMAEAYAKLTGRPGICFVTRGPGATHAAIGLHTARQDSTPMILFIGQVGRDMLGREAFQEIDYRRMFGEVAKHIEEVASAERLPEVIARAFAIAMQGRKGPTVVVLPEDILTGLVEAEDVPLQAFAEPAPPPSAIAAMLERLDAAERPLLIVGGSGWNSDACQDLVRFAEAFELPVVAGFRCQDRMDNTHRLYAGELGTSVTPALSERVKSADLLIVLGERLGEMTTSGYTLVASPVPVQALVHIHAGAEEIGKSIRPDLPIHSAVAPFLEAVRTTQPRQITRQRRAWAASARTDFEAAMPPRSFSGDLDLGAVMATIGEVLDSGAILTNGAGNYTGWPQRHYLFRSYPTQLAPISGAMGYGVPAAIAAKAVFSDRDVVCFAGDGCFMMSVQELATAVHYGLNPVFLVFDNGMFGTIRMHQEREYPARISGTKLTSPDFAALARSFGAHGETVRETEDFAPAFKRALASGLPAVIHLVIDPEVLSVRTALSELQETSRLRQAVTTE